MKPKINKKEKEIINEIVEEPMSDDFIRKYLPNAKIIKYCDLKNYSNIDDLLKNNKDYIILLYEDSPNKGHWCSCLKYGDTIEFFDSYGGTPDSQLKWVDPKTRHLLGQSIPYLTNLFNKTKKNVIYNSKNYQKEAKDINSCGRHVCMRVANLMNYDRNLKDYHNLMEQIRKETGLNYDQIVAAYFNIT